MRHRGCLSLCLLVLLIVPQIALACIVCVEKPKEALADRILAADEVVIAREDPARPFRYTPVQLLAGTAQRVDIPVLVDRTTRRRLKASPQDGVLFLRQADIWTRAGYADIALREMVPALLSQSPLWQTDAAARVAFFASILHGEHAFLRQIAIDDLSRMPYGLLRSMSQPLQGDAARQALADVSQIPWRSFYILMLGLSPHASDHGLIRTRVAAATRTQGSDQLQAWATAWIEADGQDAVGKLVAQWFLVPGRHAADQRAVIAAFATHARYGDPALRNSVLAALSDVAEKRPERAGSVAAALDQIGDFSQINQILRAMEITSSPGRMRLAPAEAFAAASYVAKARQLSAASRFRPDTVQD